MKTGNTYEFHFKDWETPLGEVIKKPPITRQYLEDVVLDGYEEFYKVARDNGKTHFIYKDSVSEIRG